jgi:phospholipid/cholesterol/gamma-HCH transport system permease protein
MLPNINRMSNFFIQFGAITHFGLKVLRQLIRPPFELMEFFKQLYLLGYKTLPLILITGFILGLVLTLQSMPVLYDFGAESLLPGMIAVSIIREMGPVITALICAGKMASGIGAELGSMRVTEQIDAMEVTGINPVNYLVLTRVLATTIMVPLLVVFADFIALVGSYMAIQIDGNITLVLFLRQAFSALSFVDVIPAVIKTFFFGFFIGLIGCYEGYFCEKGTESVGMASNAAVVKSSLAIFFINLIAVQATSILIGRI